MWDNYSEFSENFDVSTASLTMKKKFESGTTTELYLDVIQTDHDSALYVGVELNTYTKRKHKRNPDFYYSVNGRDGLRPAIWATQILLSFPEFLLWRYWDRPKVIYNIEWSDTRRRDIYYKWLSRYGFYYDVGFEGKKCLAKEFTHSRAL